MNTKTWIVIALVAVVGLTAYLLVGRKTPTPEVPPPAPVPAPPTLEETPLPPGGETDVRLRDVLRGLSSRPEWAKWLGQQDLLERGVAATDNVAEGLSPRRHLDFLAPQGAFQTEERNGREWIAPATYTRWNTFADVIASIDAKAAARAVDTLRPLLDGAYRQLGYPGASFEPVLRRALQRIAGARVIETPVEVAPKGAIYAFADPELEQLPAADKHLLRMGPRNTKLLAGKANEILKALDASR